METQDTRRYSVVIKSDTAERRRVQNDIVALCQACGYSQPECGAVRLALGEALTNAIKHGNASDPAKKVQVDCEVRPEETCIRIEDEGPGFNPTAVPDPTTPENLEKSSGRGILLMRYYMSTVAFNKKGNCVEMVKRREGVDGQRVERGAKMTSKGERGGKQEHESTAGGRANTEQPPRVA
jgi:serine/threonine-protein kinase RsbW